ncbi:hypothetical protein, partial [Pseudomonas sp. GM67]|uniref:hypothetical protein n=1 Tax=Pseudomonas sp. GM67 TaxID=1144335 RepID=UPI001EE68CD4
RTKGAKALWLLSRFSKVTRCKSETNTSHHQKNGYSHQAKPNQIADKQKRPAKAGRLVLT